MSRNYVRAGVLATTLVALFFSSLAEAQWVMLARRAVGRVEQMSQQSPQAGGANYDSAAVMLDAPAPKVYAAVLRGLQNAQGMTITRQDPTAMLVQFTNGQQIAGIKVSALGDDLSHMMISSAHTGAQPNAAAMILERILKLCADMKVECSRAQN